ncbi:retrovirus-related pol polyprotein from transposon TNT 1-94 [Tanacetum coccineum]
MTTIRMVLAMYATYDLHLEQLDVKTAFLHGNLEEEIYMLQPEGFKQKGKENLVCRLNKSLYGLSRHRDVGTRDLILSSGALNITDYMQTLVHISRGPNKDRINKLKAQLAREFEMKDLGPANKILGMQIHRDRLSSKMSPSSEKEKMKMSRVPYASAMGSLMFVMICTRPDIAHAVGVVIRYMAEPGREHWEAVKRILRYIKGTFRCDLDGSKSTTGYVFTLCGGTMKAILRKDKCLAAIGERPAEVTDDSKWDEMDGNAIANLHLALADGVLSSIEEKKSAKEIWDHLARLYEARSLHNKKFLKRKLYALRMTESTSVTEHVNNLNTLFSQLTSLSCKIDSQERAEILLQSLPDSYDQVIINLTSNVLSNYLVFNDVAAAIMEEENRRNNREDREMSLALQKMVMLCVVKQQLQMKAGRDLQICNDHERKIIGIGSIMVKMHDGTVRTIRDVRHVEDLKKNLLSLGKLDDLGCKVEIQNKIIKIIKGALVLMRGEKVAAKLYQLKGEIIEEVEASVDSHSPSHRVAVSLPFCEHCVISKQHRLKFKTSNSRSVYVLELVHSDMWQAPVLSLRGAKYFVSFIDDYSRRCWVYPINKKSDVFEVFKVYKARARRNQKAVHNGIHSSIEWSGRADEQNLVRKSKSNVGNCKLGKIIWAEVVNTACYVINRSPSTVVEMKTPMEMWTGKPVNYSDLHIFGSPIRDVVFMEEKVQENKEGNSTTKETTSIQMENEFQSNDSSEAVPQHEVNETTKSQAPITRTLNRERKRLMWQSDYVMEKAMQEEIEALHKNKTWELVPLPGGKKPIGNKWVYKIKRNSDDQVERYRARLVVKGYAQKEGIDFNEIFSHVDMFDLFLPCDLDFGSKSTTRLNVFYTFLAEQKAWFQTANQLWQDVNNRSRICCKLLKPRKEAVWHEVLLEKLGTQQAEKLYLKERNREDKSEEKNHTDENEADT